MAETRKTEIGPETLVRGDVEAQEDVSVSGRVEGTVKSTQTVVIEEEGEVVGEIEAETIVIAGVLIGNARAVGRTEVTETGAVLGDIRTPVMVLSEGGAIKGRLIMDDSSPEPVRVNTSASARPVPGRTATQAAPRANVSRTSTAARQPSSARTSRTAGTASSAASARTGRTATRTEADRTAESRIRKPSRSSAPLIDGTDEGGESES